jgi:hypothetical protein
VGRGKTCRNYWADTVPISTAKPQIGTVPYTVLVHTCGGTTPPIAGFVHVWPSRIDRLHDFSCEVVAVLKCWSVAAVTGARRTVPPAVHWPRGGERNVKRAGVVKRVGAVAGPMRHVVVAIARQKNVTHQGSPSQVVDDVVSPEATMATPSCRQIYADLCSQ